ncbi:MAG: T9SS type A sorting domain-containing protein, partial [bacterium]|nr:T9SS type A sorting domain-containing protein [bacterium]
STNSWATKANMTTARLFLGVAEVGSKIYAIGGWVYGAPNVLATNEEYDPSTDSWTTKEPLPTARRSMGVAAVGGKIYVIGGWDGTNSFATNEEYDPATDGWTVREPMLAARSGHVAVAVNDMIYAIGGGVAGPGTANEEYDPASDLWTVMAPMPTARLAIGGAEAGGKVYIIGGTDGTNALAINEEYDPVADSWATRAAMPTARYQPAVAAVTTGKTAAIVKIYVIGGFTGQEFLNTNEEYTPGVGIEDIEIDVPICELSIAPTVSCRDFNISYSIKEPSFISVKIYDASGRLVCTLVDGLANAGSYRGHWDARGATSSSVESGVYFCQLTVDNNSVTKKMIVMR